METGKKTMRTDLTAWKELNQKPAGEGKPNRTSQEPLQNPTKAQESNFQQKLRNQRS